jgi:hypothetical protein
MSDRLLAAIFRVNRSAKRYRDAASSCYSKRAYGLATHNRLEKEGLYGLKDRGIVEAYRRGLLQAEGFHGTLCIYRGNGYCFHSTLRPVGVSLPRIREDDEPLFIEAKPRGSGEMKLKDAVTILRELPADFTGFERRSFEKPVCTSCGRVGHLSYECDDPWEEEDEFIA